MTTFIHRGRELQPATRYEVWGKPAPGSRHNGSFGDVDLVGLRCGGRSCYRCPRSGGQTVRIDRAEAAFWHLVLHRNSGDVVYDYVFERFAAAAVWEAIHGTLLAGMSALPGVP